MAVAFENRIMTTPNEITWHWYTFDQLASKQLYAILKLRAEVFVVEQDCPYLDLDDNDQKSRHLLGLDDGSLVAYLRSFDDHKGHWLGRIVTHAQVRGEGVGSALMRKAMDSLPTDRPTFMHAQNHLAEFYGRFGFERRGATFLEDGIPHILMKYTPRPAV